MFGRLLGDSTAKVGEGIKSTQDAIGGIGEQATGVAKGAAKGAADVAKDAAGVAGQATAGAIVGLPGGRPVNGRERCPVARNGAPDCAPAAAALCRAKGFSSGRGTEIDAAQKCPAWVWWSGHGANSVDCTTETFVIGAVCQ